MYLIANAVRWGQWIDTKKIKTGTKWRDETVTWVFWPAAAEIYVDTENWVISNRVKIPDTAGVYVKRVVCEQEGLNDVISEMEMATDSGEEG